MIPEIRTLARRQYPRFVYGGPFGVPRQEVPVFVLHEIGPEWFENLLGFLRDNGYSTIHTEQYYAWVTAGARIPERSVLLTIDDGHASVWHAAYPLLRKYDARATVFLVPGYMRERPRRFATLEDVWSGRCDARTYGADVSAHDELVYWEEVQEMSGSGYLDFQSHSLFHHRVFVEPVLTGFLDPARSGKFYDWPVARAQESVLVERRLRDLAGLPQYRAASPFTTVRRFRSDAGIDEAMLHEAAKLGGAEFLASEPRAQAVLRKVYGRIAGNGPRGSFDDPEIVLREMEADLRTSRRLIEERTGKSVRHLCYPYNRRSAMAVEQSRRAGFVSNFVGVEPDQRANHQGADPFTTVRLKYDYLFTLPGRGRRSLAAVLLDKLRARMRGEPIL